MPGFLGWQQTPAGRVPQIAGHLQLADRLGAWKVRWGIGRMSYLVPPGLYAIGAPGALDPVVVTANYKLSFDLVRSALAGRNIWLLVLETFGINVWCAAGKGSFGTAELVRRIGETGLERVVSQRTLLLPIFGAPGVAAHEVTKETGFHLRYATLRATDLPEFLDNGLVTTPAMRQLTFTLRERLALVPVEAVLAFRSTLPVAALLLLLCWGLGDLSAGLALGTAFLGAVTVGTVVVPVLLPYLPGPSFAVKGALTGLAWSLLWSAVAGKDFALPALAGTVLALTSVSAFYALNFTGSSPFTSRSGVRKELRLALPALAVALTGAALFWAWTALL